MPTYEYACKACDHNFEIVQSFSEDTLTTCPECEQESLRKVYNAAGIIFKGDGWHIKDYGSSGSSSNAPGDADGGSTSTDSSSSSESGSTSKAASGKKDAKKDGGKGGSGSGTTAAKPAAG